MPLASELAINTSATAMQMANAIFGAGVTVQSATYQGDAAQSGIYSGGTATSGGAVPSDTGVILSTGRATDFTNSSGNANISNSTGTNMPGGIDGDAGMNSIAGVKTYDAAILNATFVPVGTVLTMQITFSSEEYLEYVGTGFNDAVGIWVNGVKATLTIGNGDVSINNINPGSNANLYRNNPVGSNIYNTEMDGLTVTLTLKAPVNPGVTNTIKIGIADGGDSIYDSNLLIAGDSLQSIAIANDDAFEVRMNGTVTYDILANDANLTNTTLTVIQINGVAVLPGDTVILPTGEQVTLNADGTITVLADADTGSNVFTYTVQDGAGNSDVGFVTVTTVPCFVAGTRIATLRGMVAAEDLQAGDRIVTRDHGAQPLRWVGTATRRARGADAPVQIAADSFGTHGPLAVSQQHRILLRDPKAAMMFGDSEVLVKARDLVNGSTVTLCETDSEVTYVHLLFDRHEIIFAEGLLSESYLPGAQTLPGFDAAVQAELLTMFPELADHAAPAPYAPARPILKSREAAALIKAA